MHTTHELIELAKQRLALKHNLDLPVSDYRLGKLMGLRQSTVSAWRTGTRGIGTEFAAQFAEVCELPVEYVYACIEHEREKNPAVLRVLESIADAFRGKAAALAAILAVGMLGNAVIPSVSDVRGAITVYYGNRRKQRRGGHPGPDGTPPSVRSPALPPPVLQGARLLSFHHRWKNAHLQLPARRPIRGALHV